MHKIPAITNYVILYAGLFWISVIFCLPVGIFLFAVLVLITTVGWLLLKSYQMVTGKASQYENYNLTDSRQLSFNNVISKFNSVNPNYPARSKWIDIQGVGMYKDEVWRVHTLFIGYDDLTHTDSKDDRSYLVLIHGMASSCLVWKNIFPKLCEKYRVIAIDLPGFGHSPTPKIITELLSNPGSEKQITDLYIEFLSKWFDDIGITKHKPSQLAHSFGGFLASHFTSKHAEKVSRLVIVSSAGLLPILDDIGALWAIFFKTSPILQTLRMLGKIATWIAYTWINLLVSESNQSEYYYWYQFLSEPSAVGDLIIGKNITVKWPLGESFWHTPCLPELLNIKVPVTLVYGDRDTIMPLHQGQIIADILEVPCLKIPETGHCITNCKHEILAEVLLESLRLSKIPTPKIPPTCLLNNNLSDLMHFTSFLSIKDSETVINSLYQWLSGTHTNKLQQKSCK